MNRRSCMPEKVEGRTSVEREGKRDGEMFSGLQAGGPWLHCHLKDIFSRRATAAPPCP